MPVFTRSFGLCWSVWAEELHDYPDRRQDQEIIRLGDSR